MEQSLLTAVMWLSLAQEFAVAFEGVLSGRVGPAGFVRMGLNAKPGRGIQAG